MTLVAQYPVTGAGRVELASQGQFSGHGDFFNAWRQTRLAAPRRVLPERVAPLLVTLGNALAAAKRTRS